MSVSCLSAFFFYVLLVVPHDFVGGLVNSVRFNGLTFTMGISTLRSKVSCFGDVVFQFYSHVDVHRKKNTRNFDGNSLKSC